MKVSVILALAGIASSLALAATPSAARPHHYERYWFDTYDPYDEYNYPAIGLGCCLSDSYADDDDDYGDDDDDYGGDDWSYDDDDDDD